MKSDTAKIAKASPRYARLLSSALGSMQRRRELSRFLKTRRMRLEFEQVLRTVAG